MLGFDRVLVPMFVGGVERSMDEMDQDRQTTLGSTILDDDQSSPDHRPLNTILLIVE